MSRNIDFKELYIEWHEKLGSSFGVTDIDQIEFGIDEITGKYKPVVIIELTFIPDSVKPPCAYLDTIIAGYNERTAKKFIPILAEELNIPAYIVGYNKSCTRFYCYNITSKNNNKNWCERTTEDMKKFIRSLKVKANCY
jgi:hypothetical protein